MAIKEIVPGVYSISLGIVNAFLIDSPQGCVLIDTGTPGNENKILRAAKELGKSADDIQHILLTHAHPDHIGSAAALRKATGARTYMHPLDAPIAKRGSGFRPLTPAPGVFNRLLVRLFIKKNLASQVAGTPIDAEVEDGEVFPIAGGLTAIHIPGHCLGQLAFLWPEHGGVLFMADACGNLRKLDWAVGYEDIAEGERSLHKLARHEFQVACFGHGKPILRGAARAIRRRWPLTVASSK